MKLNYFLLLILLLIPSVLSVPPVTQVGTKTGLDIAYPPYSYVSLNKNFILNIHVYNYSSYIRGSVGTCYVDLYDMTGKEIVSLKLVTVGKDYSKTISAGNFSKKGLYSFIIQCNTTKQVGYANGVFYVTETGYWLAEDNLSIFIYALFILASLLLFYTFFLIIFKLVTSTTTVYDVLLSWSSYILIIIVNYLGGEFILRPFVETITDQFITYMAWTNVILPLIAFIITFFIRSTQKRRPLNAVEAGGFKYG